MHRPSQHLGTAASTERSGHPVPADAANAARISSAPRLPQARFGRCGWGLVQRCSQKTIEELSDRLVLSAHH
jgi:hypothetical protein